MTVKERDNVEAMYRHYGYRCFLHKARATQRAHIIGNTRLNRKLYGSAVIDSPLNWLPACGLECNKKCDIGFIESNQKEIASIILSDIPDAQKRRKIENIILSKNNMKRRQYV